ncbi:MAG: tRNA adenosine(34) deaminase TadA [Candidatus Omnitrophica bacterium]|jgi:tRNA(adenine34) deaminase|nr:tRNA adenosine(34) deaminase TadA [Candidatus Omnitrophota bacterium]
MSEYLNDEFYMSEALKQAHKAFEKDEVPVGCVIAHESKIIARAHNQVETLKDPTAHAEMIAITQAASFLGSKWLQDVSVYVTIEPCQMCAGALVLARIKRLVFGADDPKTGAFGSVCDILKSKNINHTFDVFRGVKCRESSLLISEFFKKKRQMQ